MNKDIIQGKMTQVSGKIKEKWGNLTDDDILKIDGKRIQLIGKLTEKYGLMKEEAEKQVLKFEEGLKHKLS